MTALPSQNAQKDNSTECVEVFFISNNVFKKEQLSKNPDEAHDKGHKNIQYSPVISKYADLCFPQHKSLFFRLH